VIAGLLDVRPVLVAQAREFGVPIVTADDALSAYDVAVLW